MKKALLLALVAVIIGVLLYLQKTRGAGQGATGAPAGSGAGERVVPVTTAVAARRDVPIVVEGLGNVVPLMTVTVRSQVDGRLERVLFKEGDAVKKGQPLAQIDPRPFLIQLHQGEAALARDTANLENSRKNLERYSKLAQDRLVAQQQVDDQRAGTEQLEAAAKADRATIEAARLNLDYARIVSPIDGVTGVRLVDPGNIVKASDATGIVVVTQLDPIAVIFTLPQDDLSRVQRAMNESKLTVEALARDGDEVIGSGSLELIDNQVNAQTATIRLKAHFPNPARAFWPSQFVKARLYLQPRKNVVVVPAAAVQRGPKGSFVYVVAADKTAQPRPIEVESLEGETVIIRQGLEASEVVVTEGQNQLKPGAKVNPRELPPASSWSRPAEPRPVPRDAAREVKPSGKP